MSLDEAVPERPRRALRPSIPARDRFAARVLLAYGAARLISAGLLVLLTRYQVPVEWTGPRVTYATIVGLWDAGWYGEIAENGYPHVLPRDPDTGDLQQNPWAFYPLFPVLTRALMVFTGAPFAITGAILSLVLGGAAAVVIAGMLRDRVGERAALASIVVWATCVSSPVLQTAYTESLAILLLALVLRYLDASRWWAAAATAFLTGLARPIAVPLGIVALVAVLVRWRGRGARPIGRREGFGMIAALAGCGLAGLTWPVIAWLGTGIRSAYTDTMATWRYGQQIVPLRPWVGISEWYFAAAGPTAAHLALVAIVTLIVAVALGPWAARLGPVLRAWILAYPAYLALVLDPGTSVIRYLLPCFPWAVIAVDGAWRARRAARPGHDEAPDTPGADGPPDVPGEEPGDPPPRPGPSRRRAWGLAAGWAVLGIATQWWWLYELWRFVPPSDFPP